MKNFINGINFHELEVQKYWSFPSSFKGDKKAEVRNMIFSGQYIGSRKMDGAFYKFIKDEDGNMELLGRSKSVNGDYLDKIEWIPHLHDFFESLPNGTCLIGEIYYPNNEGSNQITKIMGCLKDKAIERQSGGDKLHYYIFDVLAYDNEIFYIKNIQNRVLMLQNIQGLYSHLYVEYAKYYMANELWEQLQEILQCGGEGVVITKIGTCYQPGKRPARQTLKVKKEVADNIDVIILGANPPTREYTGKDIINWKYWVNTYTNEKLDGEYYWDYYNHKLPIMPVTKNFFHGWAGSLKIGAIKDGKAVQIGSLSGLTEEILNNWKDYIGKVAEVSCMEIYEDTTGRGLRHPRFVQWRPDKSPNDCEWEKIYESR